MRVLISLLLFFICFIPILAEGKDEPVAIFSFADTSCGAWVKSSGDKLGRAQYISWFRGFVSGYNFVTSGNQVSLNAMPDPDTLSLYVDKYCRENPLKPFIEAVFKLIEELAPNK